MRIKKITLNNIRSYKHEEIEFPEGSILLSGDIGSGKTSILLAIEFALFGLQPGQRGSSLLKNGENYGGVVLEFEVDGQEVIIERSLKKGKTITQDYCAITIDNQLEEIAVTELKDRVLELLSYPKEFAKKQNLLYKFTVYTPQEEMKQIILEDPESRINTLRYVFGVDKYKKILENASILMVKIREEKRIKQALTLNIEQEKMDMLKKEEELETKHYNLESVDKELFLKTEIRKKAQEEKDELYKKVEEKNKFHQEIDKTKIMVLHKKESISSNLKQIKSVEASIKEMPQLKIDESKIAGLEIEISKKKIEKKDLENKNLEISSKINSFLMKNKELDSVKATISKIDLCPTCLQDVDSNYKANVFNKFDAEISENVKQIQTFTIEKKSITDGISKLDYDIHSDEKTLQDFKISKIKMQESIEKQKRAEELRILNLSLEKDIELLDQHIEIMRKSLLELNRYENLYEVKQKELEDSLKEERIAEIKVVQLKKEIEVFTKQINELKDKLKKTEEYHKQLNYLSELESWLSKEFTPLMFFVEKNVMIKLKSEFTKLFAEWFSMLVAENFNARIGDDFTPIIEQQDYEIDYNYLSGGERTAVALAYRLSLNQVINSLMSKIKTRDFMILDEPTDGFSAEQLDKMREVLYQLKAKQLIIVSHEQKIEGFVDNVIKFRKEDGVSKRI